MLTYVIIGISYGFAAAIQPGPLQTFYVSRSLANGWLRTLPAVFAPLITDGPIALLALLLLSTLPVWFEVFLRTAGGLFLFYLAYGAFCTWRAYRPGNVPVPQSGIKNLWQAATVNALNPAPYLGWSLFLGPLFLTGWRKAPADGIALLVAFYGVMILTSAVIVGLFSAARSLGERVSRPLLGLSVLALAGLGIYQLWLAGKSLM